MNCDIKLDTEAIFFYRTFSVNVVIFDGGKFRENVDKDIYFHVGVIFTILLLFPS